MAELKEVHVGNIDDDTVFYVGSDDGNQNIDKCIRPRIPDSSVGHINISGGAVLVMNITRSKIFTLHTSVRVYVMRD